MRDLSTVRGYIPEIRRKGIDVILLNIHESPGRDLLARFGFEFSPTYLIFNGNGEQFFQSNELPTAIEIIDMADAR